MAEWKQYVKNSKVVLDVVVGKNNEAGQRPRPRTRTRGVRDERGRGGGGQNGRGRGGEKMEEDKVEEEGM